MAVGFAFAIWGVVVIFWKQLEGYGSVELIIHRLIWGIFFGTITIWFRGNFGTLWKALHNKRQIRIHLINGLLITVNWLSYVYAVTHDHILQGSLAYFMVPILNTAMGFLILKERLSTLQWIAISLATLGVANEIIQFGQLPWLAILMALTFAFYGMNKTRSELGPLTSLTMEMILMLPIAVVTLIILYVKGYSTVDPHSIHDWLWMMCTGVITIIPLVLFAFGARRIQLTTIGVFQFLAPSIKFFLGVFLYGEAFPTSKLITFAFIWVALAIYLFHLFGSKKSKKRILSGD